MYDPEISLRLVRERGNVLQYNLILDEKQILDFEIRHKSRENIPFAEISWHYGRGENPEKLMHKVGLMYAELAHHLLNTSGIAWEKMHHPQKHGIAFNSKAGLDEKADIKWQRAGTYLSIEDAINHPDFLHPENILFKTYYAYSKIVPDSLGRYGWDSGNGRIEITTRHNILSFVLDLYARTSEECGLHKEGDQRLQGYLSALEPHFELLQALPEIKTEKN